MIGSSHRFHGHQSLRALHRHAHVVRSPELLLRYQRTQRSSGYRTAVVVSRKVHKSAVKRNRIRRRVYAIVAIAAPQFATNYDLAFTIFDPRLSELPAAEVERLVLDLLKRAGILGYVHPDAPHAIVKKVEKD